jgi:hypothetical protein
MNACCSLKKKVLIVVLGLRLWTDRHIAVKYAVHAETT